MPGVPFNGRLPAFRRRELSFARGDCTACRVSANDLAGYVGFVPATCMNSGRRVAMRHGRVAMASSQV
jgi:hypothetical protein